MRALVTGGAGFIGSHIAEALLERGDIVRILDNFSSGRRETIGALHQNFDPARLEVMEGDIRDAPRVRLAVRDVEVVFHSAAFVSVPQSLEEPQICFDVNVAGTHLLLESARRAGVRRAIIASSAAVYGESEALPLVEDMPLRPTSPYAVSKRVDEMYAELFTESFGLEVVALRYFNVYGPRQRSDSTYAAAIPIFVRSLLDGRPITIFGDGKQTRDLINIKDVVQANLVVSDHPNAPGMIFNICTGEENCLLEVADILCKFLPGAPAIGFSAPRAGDIYRSVGSPQKAKDILGWSAQIPLAEGLDEVVSWMRDQAIISNL